MALPQLSPGVYWRKDAATLTADGAEIRYTVLAGDQRDRPAVVLCSGFLCPDTWWHFLAPTLVDHGYRVVLLHYRGIATSSLPADPGPDAISVPRFAQDVLDVLHAAGIERTALVGHSMGGQVMVEVAQRIPDRVTTMVGVTATDRSPFTNLYGQGWLASALARPTIAALRQLREPMGTGVWRTVWRTLPFLPLARAAQAFGPMTPPGILRSYEDHAASLSGTYVVDVLEAMVGHAADPDGLRALDIPTLLVSGSHDPFTPISTQHRLAGLLPRAALHVVPDTTHAAIVEAPTEVNRAVVDHLDAHAA